MSFQNNESSCVKNFTATIHCLFSMLRIQGEADRFHTVKTFTFHFTSTDSDRYDVALSEVRQLIEAYMAGATFTSGYLENREVQFHGFVDVAGRKNTRINDREYQQHRRYEDDKVVSISSPDTAEKTRRAQQMFELMEMTDVTMAEHPMRGIFRRFHGDFDVIDLTIDGKKANCVFAYLKKRYHDREKIAIRALKTPEAFIEACNFVGWCAPDDLRLLPPLLKTLDQGVTPLHVKNFCIKTKIKCRGFDLGRRLICDNENYLKAGGKGSVLNFVVCDHHMYPLRKELNMSIGVKDGHKKGRLQSGAIVNVGESEEQRLVRQSRVGDDEKKYNDLNLGELRSLAYEPVAISYTDPASDVFLSVWCATLKLRSRKFLDNDTFEIRLREEDLVSCFYPTAVRSFTEDNVKKMNKDKLVEMLVLRGVSVDRLKKKMKNELVKLLWDDVLKPEEKQIGRRKKKKKIVVAEKKVEKKEEAEKETKKLGKVRLLFNVCTSKNLTVVELENLQDLPTVIAYDGEQIKARELLAMKTEFLVKGVDLDLGAEFPNWKENIDFVFSQPLEDLRFALEKIGSGSDKSPALSFFSQVIGAVIATRTGTIKHAENHINGLFFDIVKDSGVLYSQRWASGASFDRCYRIDYKSTIRLVAHTQYDAVRNVIHALKGGLTAAAGLKFKGQSAPKLGQELFAKMMKKDDDSIPRHHSFTNDALRRLFRSPLFQFRSRCHNFLSEDDEKLLRECSPEPSISSIDIKRCFTSILLGTDGHEWSVCDALCDIEKYHGDPKKAPRKPGWYYARAGTTFPLQGDHWYHCGFLMEIEKEGQKLATAGEDNPFTFEIELQLLPSTVLASDYFKKWIEAVYKFFPSNLRKDVVNHFLGCNNRFETRSIEKQFVDQDTALCEFSHTGALPRKHRQFDCFEINRPKKTRLNETGTLIYNQVIAIANLRAYRLMRGIRGVKILSVKTDSIQFIRGAESSLTHDVAGCLDVACAGCGGGDEKCLMCIGGYQLEADGDYPVRKIPKTTTTTFAEKTYRSAAGLVRIPLSKIATFTADFAFDQSFLNGDESVCGPEQRMDDFFNGYSNDWETRKIEDVDFALVGEEHSQRAVATDVVRLLQDEGESVAIEGRAGTGKSYTTKMVVEDLLAVGQKVALLAPTNAAVENCRTMVKVIRQGDNVTIGGRSGVVVEVEDDKVRVRYDDDDSTDSLDNGSLHELVEDDAVLEYLSRDEVKTAVDKGIEEKNLTMATIHKFFHFQRNGKVPKTFYKKAKNIDVLIVDEFSLLGPLALMFLHVAKAVNPGLRLVCLGDYRQLPNPTARNADIYETRVFRELVDYNTIELTTNRRSDYYLRRLTDTWFDDGKFDTNIIDEYKKWCMTATVMELREADAEKILLKLRSQLRDAERRAVTDPASFGLFDAYILQKEIAEVVAGTSLLLEPEESVCNIEMYELLSRCGWNTTQDFLTRVNLVYTHATRRMLNNMCVSKFGKGKTVHETCITPEIGTDYKTRINHDMVLFDGMPLICRRSNKKFTLNEEKGEDDQCIVKGEIWKVVGDPTSKSVTISLLRDPKQIRRATSRDIATHFEMGYARTVDSSQGLTICTPFGIFDAHRIFKTGQSQLSRRRGYTALTRATCIANIRLYPISAPPQIEPRHLNFARFVLYDLKKGMSAPDLTTEKVWKLGYDAGWCCHHCGKPTRDKWSLDRINNAISHNIANCVWSCITCNQKRGNDIW